MLYTANLVVGFRELMGFIRLAKLSFLTVIAVAAIWIKQLLLRYKRIIIAEEWCLCCLGQFLDFTGSSALSMICSRLALITLVMAAAVAA